MGEILHDGSIFIELDTEGVSATAWASDYVSGRGKYGRFIGDTRCTPDGKVGVWLHMDTPDAEGRDMRLIGVYDSSVAAFEALWEACEQIAPAR